MCSENFSKRVLPGFDMVACMWMRSWLLVGLMASSLLGAAQEVVISVDAAKTTGTYRPVWSYFGADEPNFVYAANGNTLLRELAGLSGTLVYVRLHNLLTTGDGSGSLKWGSTNAYREDEQGRPIYDWTFTDKIFDAMKDAGV